MFNQKFNPKQIIFEDNHLIAINKLPGQLSQKDSTKDPSLLEFVKDYLKSRDQKPGNVFLGLPHRLDRPASGIILLAKTSKALSRLSEQFKESEIKKSYWAVVESQPNPINGELLNWLKKNHNNNTSKIVSKGMKNAKEAQLLYKTVAKSNRYWLLEVILKTGRHHQIRVQLAHIGSHIKGDLKYGASRSNPGGSIYLHARQLELNHPVRKTKLKLTAPPPVDNLWQIITKDLIEID